MVPPASITILCAAYMERMDGGCICDGKFFGAECSDVPIVNSVVVNAILMDNVYWTKNWRSLSVNVTRILLGKSAAIVSSVILVLLASFFAWIAASMDHVRETSMEPVPAMITDLAPLVYNTLLEITR